MAAWPEHKEQWELVFLASTVIFSGVVILWFWDGVKWIRGKYHLTWPIQRIVDPLAPPEPFIDGDIKLKNLSLTNERISLLALFKEAEKYGLNFSGNSHAILEVSKALRQAASDGVLQFWGRERRQNDPLISIPATHWKEFQIDWVSAFALGPPKGEIKGFSNDNFFVSSRDSSRPNRKAYFDLHVDRSQAFQLLKSISLIDVD